MRAVILHMIQRDPTSRLSAKDYLTNWGPSLFPEYFTSFLQPFCQTLLPLSADLRLAAVQQAFPQMLHFMAPGTGATPNKGVEGVSLLGSQGKSPPLSAEPSQVESMGRAAVGLGSELGDGSASQSTSAAATRPSSASRGYRSGGSPNISHATWRELHMLFWILFAKPQRHWVCSPCGVARAHWTRDWQPVHHGKHCPKGLLLFCAMPKHDMLNSIPNLPNLSPPDNPISCLSERGQTRHAGVWQTGLGVKRRFSNRSHSFCKFSNLLQRDTCFFF